MKVFQVVIILAILLSAAAMESEAVRQGKSSFRGHDYRGGHSGSYSRDRGYYDGRYYKGRSHYRGSYRRHYSDFDVFIGVPLWSSWYYPYYSPYYYYSPYIHTYPEPYVRVPSIPQASEYIQRPTRESSSAPYGVWYYCPETGEYYPYTKECPEGWQEVPARPPSEIER